MTHLLRRCTAAAAIVLAANRAVAQAKPAAPSATPQRPFCWRGQPQSRCRAFALFEITTSRFVNGSKLDASVTRPGFGDRHNADALASHNEVELGAMFNVRPKAAIGGTLIGGGLEQGSPPTQFGGVAARYRRWWSRRLSGDVAAGALQMPVGVAVGTAGQMKRRHVQRTALFTDLRLGYADLLAVNARVMLASDGQGHTRTALFLGASSGSWVSTTIAGILSAWVVAFTPRGDRVTVQ